MNRIEEVPETYDLCGQIIGLAMKILSDQDFSNRFIKML